LAKIPKQLLTVHRKNGKRRYNTFTFQQGRKEREEVDDSSSTDVKLSHFYLQDEQSKMGENGFNN
jgi:hypothetical protein